MLDWHYDELGASTVMPGIDGPMFIVSSALNGNGYIAVEYFPGGLTVLQPVATLADGLQWCEIAADAVKSESKEVETTTEIEAGNQGDSNTAPQSVGG